MEAELRGKGVGSEHKKVDGGGAWVKMRMRINELEKDKLLLTSNHNQEVCVLRAELAALRACAERLEAQRAELRYQLTVSAAEKHSLSEDQHALQQEVRQREKAVQKLRRRLKEKQRKEREEEEMMKILQSTLEAEQEAHLQFQVRGQSREVDLLEAELSNEREEELRVEQERRSLSEHAQQRLLSQFLCCQSEMSVAMETERKTTSDLSDDRRRHTLTDAAAKHHGKCSPEYVLQLLTSTLSSAHLRQEVAHQHILKLQQQSAQHGRQRHEAELRLEEEAAKLRRTTTEKQGLEEEREREREQWVSERELWANEREKEREQWASEREQWASEREEWANEREKEREQWASEREDWASNMEKEREQWASEREQWASEREKEREQWASEREEWASDMEKEREQWASEREKVREQWVSEREQWASEREKEREQWASEREEWASNIEKEREQWAREREKEREHWASEREERASERKQWASEREKEREHWASEREEWASERAQWASEREVWASERMREREQWESEREERASERVRDREQWASEREQWASERVREREQWASEREEWASEREQWASEREEWASEREQWASEREEWASERMREREQWASERVKWASEREQWASERSTMKAELQRVTEESTVFLYSVYQRLLYQPQCIMGNFTWEELCDVITQQVDQLTCDLTTAKDKVSRVLRVCEQRSVCVERLEHQHKCVVSQLKLSRSQCDSLTSDLSESRGEAASLLAACTLLAGALRHAHLRLLRLRHMKTLLWQQLQEGVELEQEVLRLADALGGGTMEPGKGAARTRWRRSLWAVLAVTRWRLLVKNNHVMFWFDGVGGAMGVCGWREEVEPNTGDLQLGSAHFRSTVLSAMFDLQGTGSAHIIPAACSALSRLLELVLDQSEPSAVSRRVTSQTNMKAAASVLQQHFLFLSQRMHSSEVEGRSLRLELSNQSTGAEKDKCSLRIVGKHLMELQRKRKQMKKKLKEANRRSDYIIKWMKAAEMSCKQVTESLSQSQRPLRAEHLLLLSRTESMLGAPELEACQSFLSAVSQLCHISCSIIGRLEQEVSAHSHLHGNQGFEPIPKFTEPFPVINMKTTTNAVSPCDQSKPRPFQINPTPFVT